MARAKAITITRVCLTCGVAFPWRPSYGGKGLYCSVPCKNAKRPLIPHPTEPDTMIVPLTRGKVALIDAADAGFVGQYNWYALNPSGNEWYAARNAPDRKGSLLHRELMNAEPGEEVDHVNRDGLDCRRRNMRWATRSQNTANQGLRRDNTSGYRGVCWHRQGQKWYARLCRRSLGLYVSAEDAARAYDAAAVARYGDFANINFPNEHAAHGKNTEAG